MMICVIVGCFSSIISSEALASTLALPVITITRVMGRAQQNLVNSFVGTSDLRRLPTQMLAPTQAALCLNTRRNVLLVVRNRSFDIVSKYCMTLHNSEVADASKRLDDDTL